MRFPVLPGTAVHGGVFFGKVSDDQYTFSSVNNKTGGYHMLLRGNGDFQLYTHTAGVTTGTQLATVNAGTILANTVYSFEVEVNATQVIARALDTPTVRTLTVSDTTYRGKYWGIHNGSLTDPTTIPRFRTGVIVQT
jgi:glycerophosphoryl diester phosphodiesterase